MLTGVATSPFFSVPEKARLARLERGLTLLEELECRVVVADLPDMSPATQGIMIHASQVPSPSTLERLNARIRSWVADAPDRHLIGFASCIDNIRAGHEIRVGSVASGSVQWPAARAAELLQPDDLHPTLHGASMIAALVAEVLVREVDSFERDAVDLDVSAVAARVRERVAAKRAEFDASTETQTHESSAEQR